MSFIIGRGEADIGDKPTGSLGTYRALDGSEGAPLHLDLNDPHAMLIVGKRGYGKSYTMGVVAESLARTPEVAPVLIDPMGVFATLAKSSSDDPVPTELVESPAVTPDTLDPRSWCALLGLSPESGAGSLVWQAAQETATMPEMFSFLDTVEAAAVDKRAAKNHLQLADSWDVFDEDGLDATALASNEVTVLDVSGLDSAPMNAVARGVAEALYRGRVDGDIARLPWLLIDEAHTFFQGVAGNALELILTRGRAPGVSLVLATQRPSAVPEVGISQADILLSHRLTSLEDIEALQAAQPTYMNESIGDKMPEAPGEVIIVDDSTETVHAAQIRQRHTPHGGDSPSADEVDVPDVPDQSTGESATEKLDAGELDGWINGSDKQ